MQGVSCLPFKLPFGTTLFKEKNTVFTKIIFYTETFTCQPLNIVSDKQFKGNYSDFYWVNFNVSINFLCLDLACTRPALTQRKMWTSKYT